MAAAASVLYRFASPATFYPLAGALAPWFFGLAGVFCVAGLYIGFVLAPTDYQQGEAYRIIYLHVPAAWMSMFMYVLMAGYGTLYLALSTRLSKGPSKSCKPTNSAPRGGRVRNAPILVCSCPRSKKS